MSDDRGIKGLTHITRINDWIGSDSYVQGARRDQGDTPMPEGQKYPYILTTKAYHDGALYPPGYEVWLAPEQRGPHHAQKRDVKYPPDPPPAPPTVTAVEHAEKLAELVRQHKTEMSQLTTENLRLKAELETAEARAKAKAEK